MNYMSTTMVVLIALLIIWRRTNSMYRPVRGKGIRMLLPLLFLIPGAALIANPNVHLPAWEWLAAIALGFVLALPLIGTTGYEIREDGRIYAKKNKWFIVAIVCVLLLRLGLRSSLGQLTSEEQMALFMTVAIAYLLPWRVASFYKFRTIRRQLQDKPITP